MALPLTDLTEARLVLTDELIADSLSRRPPPPEDDAEDGAGSEASAAPQDSPNTGARKPRGDA